MDFTQIIITVVPAIVSGLISYFSAVKTSNNEIEKLNVNHKNEMEKMEKELELQKEKIELQKQSGENEVMNNLLGNYMGDLLKGKSPQQLVELEQELQKYAPNDKNAK